MTTNTLPLRDMFQSPPPAPRPTVPSSSSRKVKRPPSLTSHTLTRFFTPRSASTGVGACQDGRRPFRESGQNEMADRSPSTPRSSRAWSAGLTDENGSRLTPPWESRKRSLPMTPDSSPFRSSPLKRTRWMRDGCGSVIAEEDESDDGSLRTALPRFDLGPFFGAGEARIERMDYSATTVRLMERAMGTSHVAGRPGSRQVREMGWSSSTRLYSPGDCQYRFPDGDVPFCVATGQETTLAAIGDETGNVRVFSAVDSLQSPVMEYEPHKNAIVDIAFADADHVLATASGDQTCQVSDVETGRSIYSLAGHSGSVKQIRFQPGNCHIIATSSRDGSICIWDLRCSSRQGRTNEMNAGPARVGGLANTIFRAHSASTGRSDTVPARRSDFSVTALSFLSPDRPHLLLSGSEASTSLRLWDIRGRYSRAKGPMPLSATEPPAWHSRHRPFGLSSIVIGSGGGPDGSRVYAVSRDSSVYVYSTSHLVLGHAPALDRDVVPKYRVSADECGTSLGPLYGLRSQDLQVSSFFVKASIRPASPAGPEMLAVGSSAGCPVVFVTDEAACKTSPAVALSALPGMGTMTPTRRASSVLSSDSGSASPFSGRFRSMNGCSSPVTMGRCASPFFGRSSQVEQLDTYDTAVALRGGHEREVTAVSWTRSGQLVSVGDDLVARLWIEDQAGADHVRSLPAGHVDRKNVGVADAAPDGVDDHSGNEGEGEDVVELGGRWR